MTKYNSSEEERLITEIGKYSKYLEQTKKKLYLLSDTETKVDLKL